MTPADPAQQPAAPARTSFLDRLYGTIPLVSVFFWLALLYAWQARNHASPWFFTDELEMTDISRAIATTGHGARRGVPYGFHTLYTYLVAPGWRLSSTASAYAAVKYIGVLTMTAAVFPAYFLTRLVASPRASLFAAAATVAGPSLAYSSLVLPEPLAYTWSTLCLFLLAKAFTTRSPRWLVAAGAGCVVAPLVRSQLAVLVAVYLLTALFLWLSGERARAWRARWSRGDWLGAAVLTVGAVVFLNGFISSRSHEWLIATGYYQGRILEYGLWAAGSLTFGLGILPVVAALAGLVRPRGEPATPGLRAFVALLLASLVAFGLYGAVKAAYISTNFATRVEERNLIYLAPLLFAATALWLDRPRLRLVPLACAVGFVAYLIVSTPYSLDTRLSADAFGLSILELANRDLSFSNSGVEALLFGALALATLLLLVPRYRHRAGRLATGGVLVAAAGLVLAWNLTGQIAASNASNDTSRQLITPPAPGGQGFPRPLSWLDHATGGKPSLYLGAGLNQGSQLGIWLTEFWNPGLKQVWSIDGSSQGPFPTLTPNLADPLTGRLSPDPGYPYVVTEQGLDVVGARVGLYGNRWQLFRVAPPLRLAHSSTGIGGSQIYAADNQIGCDSAPCPAAAAAYNQYATPGGRAGWLTVTASRTNACQAPLRPATVAVVIGHLVKGADKQPHLGAVTASARTVLDVKIGNVAGRGLVLPTPRPPFRVEIRVSPTFSPVDYGQSDARHLGAIVGFSFSEGQRPAATLTRCS